MTEEIINKLNTVRIDIKNNGAAENAVKIEAENYQIFMPAWFTNEQGIGQMLVSENGQNKVKITAVKNGQLLIAFKGMDYRFEGKCFPVWIDYKSIKINGKEILSEPVQTWHDKPFRYELPVKDGQEVLIEYETQLHPYEYNELKETISRLHLLEDKKNEVLNAQILEIKESFNKLNRLFDNMSSSMLLNDIKPLYKNIKIDFVDQFAGYNKTSNLIINSLRKYYTVEISDNPDFLFCSCYGTEHLNYKNCVKISLTGENVLPNFNEYDYGVGFDYINFGDRYFRFDYIANPGKSIQNRLFKDDDMLNRRFCNFIYSNATSGEGAVLRQDFCKELMKYKPVDCPGKVLHNMDTDELEPRNGNWGSSKIEFLKKYKFTIAFENSKSDGYTTEKLVQPLRSYSVPIYWGNPLVVKDFNPKAFINANDYDNDFHAIIERVKELDNDPDKYLAMLREAPMQADYDFEQQKKFENWLIRIIERGNKPFNKDPRNWDKTKKLKTEHDQLKKEVKTLKDEIAVLKSKQNPDGNNTPPRKPERGISMSNLELIEWTNTWIENAPDLNRKRILCIGDSVLRDFRGKITALLPNYAIDYIGSSASLEDRILYDTCETFFANADYKYSLILLNIGAQHGLYLKTKENEMDKKRYSTAVSKLFQYVMKHAPQFVVCTTTPNSMKEDQNQLNAQRCEEIKSRNEIQREIAESMNMAIIDLYQFALENKFPFRDVQHFIPEVLPKFAEYIISELKKRELIENE